MYFLSYGCSFISGPASFRLAWYVPYNLNVDVVGVFKQSQRLFYLSH